MTESHHKVQLSIRLSSETQREFKVFAAQMGRPLNGIVVEAMREHMARAEAEEPAEGPLTEPEDAPPAEEAGP